MECEGSEKWIALWLTLTLADNRRKDHSENLASANSRLPSDQPEFVARMCLTTKSLRTAISAHSSLCLWAMSLRASSSPLDLMSLGLPSETESPWRLGSPAIPAAFAGRAGITYAKSFDSGAVRRVSLTTKALFRRESTIRHSGATSEFPLCIPASRHHTT